MLRQVTYVRFVIKVGAMHVAKKESLTSGLKKKKDVTSVRHVLKALRQGMTTLQGLTRVTIERTSDWPMLGHNCMTTSFYMDAEGKPVEVHVHHMNEYGVEVNSEIFGFTTHAKRYMSELWSKYNNITE